jgi:hypothetical protein
MKLIVALPGFGQLLLLFGPGGGTWLWVIGSCTMGATGVSNMQLVSTAIIFLTVPGSGI